MDTVKQTCKKVWSSCRRSHAYVVASTPNYDVLSEKKQKQKQKKKSEVAPAGYFRVDVGPDRERFLMKIKLANHPLFRNLLEDAEKEYGFKNDGPIWLPCQVDLFCDALEEMENSTTRDDYHIMGFAGCIFPKSTSSVL